MSIGPKPDLIPKGKNVGTIMDFPVGTEVRMSGTLRLKMPRSAQSLPAVLNGSVMLPPALSRSHRDFAPVRAPA